MTRSAVVVLVAAAILAFAAATPTQAGCAYESLQQHIDHPDVTAVFRARIVSVRPVSYTLVLPRGQGSSEQGQIAAIEVSRVWKGTVTRQFELLYRVTLDSPPGGLAAGTEYLVFADVLSSTGRQQFSLTEDGAAAIASSGCGVLLVDNPTARRLMDETPGYEPTP